MRPGGRENKEQSVPFPLQGNCDKAGLQKGNCGFCAQAASSYLRCAQRHEVLAVPIFIFFQKKN